MTSTRARSMPRIIGWSSQIRTPVARDGVGCSPIDALGGRRGVANKLVERNALALQLLDRPADNRASVLEGFEQRLSRFVAPVELERKVPNRRPLTDAVVKFK